MSSKKPSESQWPWWAQFAALVLVLVIASFLIVLPILTVEVLGSQYAFSSETDLWASMVAILLGLTTMTVTGVFVFMTFRIDRGARLEAQRTAEKAAKKAVKKTMVDDLLRELEVQFKKSMQKIDQVFCDIKKEDVSNLKKEVKTLNTKVFCINTKMSDINTEVSNINTTMSNINTEVSNIETKVSDINTEVSNIETKVSDINTEVSNINTEVSNIETKIEENRKSIEGKFNQSMKEIEELFEDAKASIAADGNPPDGGTDQTQEPDGGDGMSSDGGGSGDPPNEK